MPDWLLLIQWNLSEVSLILIKERVDRNEWEEGERDEFDEFDPLVSPILELIFENLTISYNNFHYLAHEMKLERIRNRFRWLLSEENPSIVNYNQNREFLRAVENSRIIVGEWSCRETEDWPDRVGRGVQISGRAEGWKSFLPLTKISNNWPENERLWRIKRGHHRKTSL